MEIIIRQCVPEDVQGLRDISVRTFEETFAAVNTAENMRAFLEQAYNIPKLRRELENPHTQFYFLYADGALAGYLKLNDTPAQSDIRDPDSLEIERLYIIRAHLGHGLGGVLMEKALAAAAALKKTYVWLGVWEHNYRAQGFYKKHGFRQIGAHTFVMGDDPQIDLLMRRDL